MMESIEKLRDELQICETTGSRPTIAFVAQCADEIEAEIESRYMKLPVDADGVPIRVGEEMTCHGDTFNVCAVAPAKIHRWVTVKLGETQTTYSYDPKECTHVKPRTIEDVLTDFARDVNVSHSDFISADGEKAYLLAAINETADEIRELMEVSE